MPLVFGIINYWPYLSCDTTPSTGWGFVYGKKVLIVAGSSNKMSEKHLGKGVKDNFLNGFKTNNNVSQCLDM